MSRGRREVVSLLAFQGMDFSTGLPVPGSAQATRFLKPPCASTGNPDQHGECFRARLLSQTRAEIGEGGPR
ncbi:MAG: hypothetical protein AB1700_11635, partial [Bacillota bacterium]